MRLLIIVVFMSFIISCGSGSDSSEGLADATPPPSASPPPQPAPVTQPPPQQRRLLRVPFVAQQTEVWCWAAVIEMVAAYYGRPAPQCATLSYWFGADCCSFPSFCATTGTDFQIQQSFSILAGLGSSFIFRPLTWQEFTFEIDIGRPVILFYRNSFAGHVVVAYGYDPSRRTMFIHDPFFGQFEVQYGQTFTYNSGGGPMSWVQTLGGFQPL